MKVVFFGSGAFGVPTLAALATRHEVTGVVTQPDRPAGRGGKMTPTPIGAWAAEHAQQVPLLKPERVNEAAVLEQIRALEAQAWVVIAFGQYLGTKLLAGKFAINLHASLLPRWRGAAPINAAILAGDTRTGNSVIGLAKVMDAGAVYGQSSRLIDPLMTAGELHDVLAADGPELVMSVLDQLERHELGPMPQDEALVTIAPKLSKADGWIDFEGTAEAGCRRVQGLTPWPGVTASFRGEELKLRRVAAHDEAPAESLVRRHDPAHAGTLLDAALGLVLCGKAGTPARERTVLRLLEVQPAGKGVMRWEDFARGRRPQAGELLTCVPPPNMRSSSGSMGTTEG